MSHANDLDRLDLTSRLRTILAGLDRTDVSLASVQRSFRDLASGLVKLPSAARSRGAEMIGEAAPLPAIAHHVDCLCQGDWAQPGKQTKIRWHLKMIGSALDPMEPQFTPLVSVVVIASEVGRATAVIEEVAKQTHRAIEILLVLTQPTGRLPEPSGDAMPIRQVMADSSSPWNAGLAAAKGDFVQFLEEGDLLTPAAVAEKLQVWKTFPDARLCLSPMGTGDGANESYVGELGEDAVTRAVLGDPLLFACQRFPFPLHAQFAPRWYLEKVGPREEDLPAEAQESRYWFRMARAGAKSVGLTKPTRRSSEASAHSAQGTDRWLGEFEAALRSAEELASQPRLYRYVASLIAKGTWLLDRAFDDHAAHGRIEAGHERLLAFEAELGRGIAGAEGVTAILLDQLVFMLRQKRRLAPDASRPTLRLWDEREDALLSRLDNAPVVTGSDLRRWLPELPPRPFAELARSEQSALKFALEQLQVSMVLGELPLRFRSLERVAADYPGHPYERYWRSAFRLARLLGDDAARSVFRQKLVRNGWHLLGRARRVLADVPAR